MSFLGWAAGAIVVSKIIKKEKQRQRAAKEGARSFLWSLENNSESYDEDDDEDDYEYERGQQEPRIPCRFVDGFSEEEFEAIVKREARKIRRIKFVEEINGMVKGYVQSQSGISDWIFYIDFNFAGHITGAYSVFSDNSDSAIPTRLAENIAAAVRNLIGRNHYHDDGASPNESFGLYCPYCGEFTPGRNIKFCVYCGKPLV